ncbi:hypothetical protein V2J09_004422 [Rumex salicifolius]
MILFGCSPLAGVYL